VTPVDPFSRRPAQSPNTIRLHTFTTRRRGLDPAEVKAYLTDLAEQVEYANADRAELRAELEGLRDRSPGAVEREHITAHAVGLLSQAQQIADSLVAEAEQYAKDLVETARHQQRDVLKQAHDSVESASRQLPSAGTRPLAETPMPTTDLDYVRTFTQVAHIQLRSVLDALADQVERLGQFPQTTATPVAVARDARPSSDAKDQIQWWTDLSTSPRPPAPPN
jgi:DivIVA domain-containing protein